MTLKLPDPTLLAGRLGLYDAVPYALAQSAAAQMDTYVPRKTGALAGSVSVSPAQNGVCTIRYSVPYARKVYYSHKTNAKWLETARQDGAFSRR